MLDHKGPDMTCRCYWSPATVGLLVCLFSCLDGPAHAYLDPGTGSYLLQLAAGVIFAGLFALKAYWGKLTGAARRKAAAPTPDETDGEPQ